MNDVKDRKETVSDIETNNEFMTETRKHFDFSNIERMEWEFIRSHDESN